MVRSQSKREFTTNDALEYLAFVKDRFKSRRKKYYKFLHILKEFRAQRIDVASMTESVKDLFRGHRDLILGFNWYLPTGNEITVPLEDEGASDFMKRVKNRLKDDIHVYKLFKDILRRFQREKTMSTDEFYAEVKAVLQDHQDLLAEFTGLPSNAPPRNPAFGKKETTSDSYEHDGFKPKEKEKELHIDKAPVTDPRYRYTYQRQTRHVTKSG